jgi:uncharacterized protein (TIGR02217 family)
MSMKPSRFVIPGGTDLSTDPDVYPILVGQEFIAKKTPVYSTAVTTSTSGKERRRPQWPYCKWKFEVGYEFLRNVPTDSELQSLFAFFGSKKGQYQEFLFYDPEDNVVETQSFATGNGVRTVYTLQRTITHKGKSMVDPVRAFYGNPVIRINGSTTTAFTVGDYGQITFTSAPANGAVLSWSGSVLFVCRFDDDELDVEQVMSRLWAGRGVSFGSVKP